MNTSNPHRTTTYLLRCRHWLSIAGLMLCASAPAAAFTFSDGTKMACTARGIQVGEYEAPPDDPVVAGRVGRAQTDGTNYLLVWNAQRLGALPPEVHDFIFFHECGHAQARTDDEVKANCEGLKAMRAAGRAGPAIETKLAAFFGADTAYWRGTIACANAPPRVTGTDAPPRAPGSNVPPSK
jgi:hypothetical protein